jgi:signal transduction histidine kinase
MLSARDVRGAAELAGVLVDARLGPEWIDRVAEAAGEERLQDALGFVAACACAGTVIAEVEQATTRIADLADAVRNYSYLDQGPRQTVDIHAGLESTLGVLAHKLGRKHVDIVRDFDDDLPTVEASGSELNQVWTNLIDNAVDALGDRGRITLRTRRRGSQVLVEVAHDGPGCPRAARPDLRRVLHHQARRPGDRPGARRRPADRDAQRRRAPHAVAVRRHPLPRRAPGGVSTVPGPRRARWA